MNVEADVQNILAANSVLAPALNVSVKLKTFTLRGPQALTGQKLGITIPHMMIPRISIVTPENGTDISCRTDLFMLAVAM